MRLLRIPKPFDHPHFVFEPKLDGFRALVIVRGHRCELVSRNGNAFRTWPQLAEEIAHAVKAERAVLDGEICCLEPDGATDFKKLLFRREWPSFYAFDLLAVNAEGLRALPLLERKRRLLAIIPTIDCRLLYLDHVEECGRDLFRAACERDLERILAKWTRETYYTDGRRTSWLKVKNPEYSKMRDRHELFEGRRHAGGERHRAPNLVLV